MGSNRKPSVVYSAPLGTVVNRKSQLPCTMSEIRVHAAFMVQNEESFLHEAKKMIEATQAEPGCLHYQLYRQTDQPGSYAMIETWESQDDLTRHSQADHVKTFQASQKENIKAVIQCFQPIY